MEGDGGGRARRLANNDDGARSRDTASIWGPRRPLPRAGRRIELPPTGSSILPPHRVDLATAAGFMAGGARARSSGGAPPAPPPFSLRAA
jgi:hypothetical protein